MFGHFTTLCMKGLSQSYNEKLHRVIGTKSTAPDPPFGSLVCRKLDLYCYGYYVIPVGVTLFSQPNLRFLLMNHEKKFSPPEILRHWCHLYSHTFEREIWENVETSISIRNYVIRWYWYLCIVFTITDKNENRRNELQDMYLTDNVTIYVGAKWKS